MKPPQDELEKKVEELVTQLDDDSLEVRDAAAEKIDALPAEALPFLKKAREKAGNEAGARLDDAITRIEARVKLAEAMGKPALVTIKAEKRAASELFAELARQSGRVIEVKKEIENEPVTVSIENLPFWPALETICRAHGGLVWNSLADKVSIEKHAHPAVPWIQEGALALFLTEVSVSRNFYERGSSTSFHIGALAGFEKGKAPVRIRWTIRTLKDDRGRDLLKSDERGGNVLQLGQPARFDDAGLATLSYYQNTLPPEDSRKVSELAGEVEYVYPLAMDEAKVEAPWMSGQKSVKLGDLTITLNGYGVQQSRYLHWSARVEGKGELRERVEFLTCEAVDKDGKSVGYVYGYAYSGEQVEFNYWDRDDSEAKPVAIVLRRPRRVGIHTMKFSFKDIDLR